MCWWRFSDGDSIVRDLFGQKVEVGDCVAYIRTDYRDLDIGVVTKIGKEKLTIEYEYESCGKVYTDKTFRYSRDVVKKVKVDQ